MKPAHTLNPGVVLQRRERTYQKQVHEDALLAGGRPGQASLTYQLSEASLCCVVGVGSVLVGLLGSAHERAPVHVRVHVRVRVCLSVRVQTLRL